MLQQSKYYHRLDILPDVSLSKIYVRDFQDARVSLRQLRQIARVRFAPVKRAGKCRSREISSRHRSGVIINVHARTSGKCNAHFLLRKR